jgi:hypothetical protein
MAGTVRGMALRLRQVVLVAPELGPALEEVREGLGIEPCFHDPGVAEFGLENVLFPIGDQFLEIVTPVQEGTTAGRMLERRGGAGGYMLIVQCDDLDRRRSRLADLGVRVIWEGGHSDIRGTHLHPKDVGGAIVSIDEASPWESWRWAGPSWRDHIRSDTVTSVSAVAVSAAAPGSMAARWASVLDLPMDADTTVLTDDAAIRFVDAGDRGDGLDAVEVSAADRSRTGDVIDLCSVRFHFV